MKNNILLIGSIGGVDGHGFKGVVLEPFAHVRLPPPPVFPSFLGREFEERYKLVLNGLGPQDPNCIRISCPCQVLKPRETQGEGSLDTSLEGGEVHFPGLGMGSELDSGIKVGVTLQKVLDQSVIHGGRHDIDP